MRNSNLKTHGGLRHHRVRGHGQADEDQADVEDLAQDEWGTGRAGDRVPAATHFFIFQAEDEIGLRSSGGYPFRLQNQNKRTSSSPVRYLTPTLSSIRRR